MIKKQRKPEGGARERKKGAGEMKKRNRLAAGLPIQPVLLGHLVLADLAIADQVADLVLADLAVAASEAAALPAVGKIFLIALVLRGLFNLKKCENFRFLDSKF